LRANKDREALKHFGAAGTPHSHTKPYCVKGTESKTGLSNRWTAWFKTGRIWV